MIERTNEEIRGTCWHCGRGLTAADYGREQTCLGCGKPTRCCLNCRHYAPGRPNACMEPMVEHVVDKAKANFCELLEPVIRDGAIAAGPAVDAQRQAAEALFK